MNNIPETDISPLSREMQILLCIAKNIDPEAHPQYYKHLIVACISRHYIFCPSIGVRFSWLIESNESNSVAIDKSDNLIIYIPVCEVANPKFDPKELQAKIEVALSDEAPAGAEFFGHLGNIGLYRYC